MKHLFFIIPLLILGLTSCENGGIDFITGSQNTVIVDEVNPEKSVEANYKATFLVDGMMCSKGCGAVIRKGLYETGAIAEVEVHFDEEDESGEITVYFDKNNINSEEIIKTIKELPSDRYSAELVDEEALPTSI